MSKPDQRYNPWVPGELPSDFRLVATPTEDGVRLDLTRKVAGEWVPAAWTDFGQAGGFGRAWRLYGSLFSGMRNTPEAHAAINAMSSLDRARTEHDLWAGKFVDKVNNPSAWPYKNENERQRRLNMADDLAQVAGSLGSDQIEVLLNLATILAGEK